MKIACLVYVRNYYFWFKYWLKYYCQFDFDVYVVNLSDKQKDLPTHGYNFTEIKLKGLNVVGTGNYHDLCVVAIEEQQKRLLKKYDYVVYSDLDEFIIVNPDKYKDLGDYVRKAKGKEITCTGREIIQSSDESAMKWEKPWMEQRDHWWPHSAHFKTAISSIPQTFVWGFHYPKSFRLKSEVKELDLKVYIFKRADPDLIMVHTRFIDADEFESLKTKREGSKLFKDFVKRKRENCKKIPDKYKEAF